MTDEKKMTDEKQMTKEKQMTNEKYRLTDEKMVSSGEVVYRIEAISDFGDVKKGDKGGFVGCEENLSANGTCWLYDDATASGEAMVCEEARVYSGPERNGVVALGGVSEGAIIRGSACVYGSSIMGMARIQGSAVLHEVGVSNSAKVSDGIWHVSPLHLEGTGMAVCIESDGELSIGMDVHSIEYWKENYESIMGSSGCSDKEIEEYGFMIDIAEKWWKFHTGAGNIKF